MAEAGAAIYLPQSQLSAAKLDELAGSLLDSPDRLSAMATAARQRGRPHAAEQISDRIGVLSG
jgi:UDP-N-acetylglucosamine--N-acetylmuramyl-(pentapeptide) pyrophosphoryl-undecaprenol N-acetylglucosamine transferase